MCRQEIKKFLGGKVEPEGREWFVQIVKAESLPPQAKVTAVAIVACLDNKVLFIKNERGWDIPGGHVEEADESIEQTAKRELFEETGVECDTLELVGYMVSDFYPDRSTYIAVLNTRIGSLTEFTPQYETVERRLLTPRDCGDSYYGNPALIEALLRVALEEE